ncbi:MAG: amidohydrolase family protein, partial [Chloroflexota bacterium]
VHMAVPNFTRGACDASGNVKADVAQNCLRLRGYPATADGVRAALKDGYASTVVQEDGRMAYVSGERGIAIFDERDTDARLSFPVNRMDIAFQLTAARRPDTDVAAPGEFIIDAVASDGGVIPRNVNIEKTMAMVRFGALTPLEMVQKLSYNPARMIGLPGKGRIAPGADADITVVDPLSDSAWMTIAAGEVVAEGGRATGSGGTMLVTDAGQAAPRAQGLPYRVVDVASDSLLYHGYRG